MKTRTAKQYLINANIAGRNIKVPECAIKYNKKKNSHKKKIPILGQDNNKVLKSIGYSKNKIASFFKKKIF